MAPTPQIRIQSIFSMTVVTPPQTILQALTVPMAQAERDGKWQQVPARELLPGDIIALKGGDVIPADAQVCTDPRPVSINF